MPALRSPTAAFLRNLGIFEGLSHIFNEPIVTDVVIEKINSYLWDRHTYSPTLFSRRYRMPFWLALYLPREASIKCSPGKTFASLRVL